VYYHERPKFASTRSSAISTSDLLADPAVCKRDIPDLVRLGINTLFLNGVNAELNHAECMQSLQDAGIYVLVQLNPIYVNVYTGNGMPVADWGYLSEKANSRLIDGFQKFSNTLGFVWKSRAPPASEIGRELAFGRTDVGSLKEYIRKMNYRRIPIGSIGYCHRKSSVIDFFTCGSQTNSIDFYGMNHALDPPGECEVVSPPIYDGSVETYRNSSIPLFVFYGDLAKTQPDFPEVTDIYANSTSEVFSGGILLSWYEADDHDQGQYCQYYDCAECKGSLYSRTG
jgi:hypothetical protein